MLISLGRKSSEEQDLVGLLLECHKRIRAFSLLAQEIGRRQDLPEDELVDACERCERYFVEALPLHVEDEEEGLFPRLIGLDPDVDAALRKMHDQHQSHGPNLEVLVRALRQLKSDPKDGDARRSLAEISTLLVSEFEAHLTLEEEQIFPFLRQTFSPEQQRPLIDELRARRVGPRD